MQKRYLRPDGAVVWAQTRGTAVAGVQDLMHPDEREANLENVTQLLAGEIDRYRSAAQRTLTSRPWGDVSGRDH